jgi:hypothetical protein
LEIILQEQLYQQQYFEENPEFSAIESALEYSTDWKYPKNTSNLQIHWLNKNPHTNEIVVQVLENTTGFDLVIKEKEVVSSL